MALEPCMKFPRLNRFIEEHLENRPAMMLGT